MPRTGRARLLKPALSEVQERRREPQQVSTLQFAENLGLLIRASLHRRQKKLRLVQALGRARVPLVPLSRWKWVCALAP